MDASIRTHIAWAVSSFRTHLQSSQDYTSVVCGLSTKGLLTLQILGDRVIAALWPAPQILLQTFANSTLMTDFECFSDYP